MNFTEYAACDGLALADLIARGEVTVAEVTACAQAAIDDRNPQLNAVLTDLDGQAYANNKPFSGIPFLIKELVLTAAGAKSRGGSRSTPDLPAPADTNLMAAYRQAGLHLIGTTQTPEMGYNATTETVAFGPVHNPWKTGHSAGGSSGGSGAAVAAGLVPIAHANDGGGSIRIPARFCGIYGLKPSFGRVPYYPPSAVEPLSHAGPMTRTVRDAALMLSAIAGPFEKDRNTLPADTNDYNAVVDENINGLKIAWSPDLGYANVDPEVAVHGGEYILRADETFSGFCALRVGFADDLSAPDAASGNGCTKYVRIVVATTGIVDLGATAELAPGDDHDIVVKTAFVEVL